MDTSTWIAIIIFVVLSAIVIGLIFLLSKKKKPANQFTLMPITPVKSDIEVEPLEKKEEVKEEKVVKEEIKEEIKEEEPIKEEVKEEVKNEGIPSLIDIPIKEMDDSPITIEEAKSLVESNNEEEVVIGESKPLKETKQEDIVFLEEEKTEPIKEEIKEEPKEEIKEETVETKLVEPEEPVTTEYIEQEKPVETVLIDTSEEPKEVVMPNDAFNQLPNEDRDINTNFKVEDKREYVGKTEILDIEEVKRAIGNKE